MATRQQTTGLTYQDIVDWPEERRELLDGEFVVTPSPSALLSGFSVSVDDLLGSADHE